VDTVAEKQTKIVSRQKCTVPETTHDTKTGNMLSRQKKVGNACRGRKLSEAEVLCVGIFFLMIFVRRILRKRCSERPLFFT
jgi:hypothetical protein